MHKHMHIKLKDTYNYSQGVFSTVATKIVFICVTFITIFTIPHHDFTSLDLKVEI